MQKAYAKFFGSYYKMNGGFTPTALYNLTGGLVLYIQDYTGRLCRVFSSTVRMLIQLYLSQHAPEEQIKRLGHI